MHTIPPSVAREAYARLCALLPPPAIDTPECRAARDDDAMDAVAALRPANALEARLAVEIIAADAYAMDCLRLAGQTANDLSVTLRCRAQALAMMRQVKNMRLVLEREQAMRPKAPPPACAEAPTAPQDEAGPVPCPDLVASAGTTEHAGKAVSHRDDRQPRPAMSSSELAIDPPHPVGSDGATPAYANRTASPANYPGSADPVSSPHGTMSHPTAS